MMTFLRMRESVPEHEEKVLDLRDKNGQKRLYKEKIDGSYGS